MTEPERQLLLVVAQALLQAARWGQNTGIDGKMRAELNDALRAFQRSQEVPDAKGERLVG
jgi:hypothetical protein